MRKASEEESLHNNVTHQRPHHRRSRGERTAMFTERMTQIATSMRDIAAQNMAMHELLIQARDHQGSQMPQGSYPTQEAPVSRSQGHTNQHRERPLKREVGIEATSYVQGNQPSEPHLGDNFPQEYEEQRSVSVFDRIGEDPSNRVRPVRRSVCSDQEQEQAPPSRNRRDMRNLVDWGSRGEAPPPPQSIQDDEGSDGPCQSFEIDDNVITSLFQRRFEASQCQRISCPLRSPNMNERGPREAPHQVYDTNESQGSLAFFEMQSLPFNTRRNC